MKIIPNWLVILFFLTFEQEELAARLSQEDESTIVDASGEFRIVFDFAGPRPGIGFGDAGAGFLLKGQQLTRLPKGYPVFLRRSWLSKEWRRRNLNGNKTWWWMRWRHCPSGPPCVVRTRVSLIPRSTFYGNTPCNLPPTQTSLCQMLMTPMWIQHSWKTSHLLGYQRRRQTLLIPKPPTSSLFAWISSSSRQVSHEWFLLNASGRRKSDSAIESVKKTMKPLKK